MDKRLHISLPQERELQNHKELQRHNLEQADGVIDFYMNANKTEFMYFKEGDTRSVKPLKLVDRFIYLSSNISFTEKDINLHQVKAWTTSDYIFQIEIWSIR